MTTNVVDLVSLH